MSSGDVCEVLAESDAATFRVSGFGQDRWPVDVRTDLSVLLEQLPAAIKATSTEPVSSFTLDFYEQGVERRLAFVPDDGVFSVRCESDTDWQPDPKEERMGTRDLWKLLCTVRDRFLLAVRTATPELYEHEWLRDWAQG